MSGEVDAPLSAKEILKRLMHATSSAATLRDFLENHLADDSVGAVAPRLFLNKEETIRRFCELFAIAAGGSASMLATVEEGASASCRILLTSRKHDLKTLKTLNTESERVFEGAIWVDLKPDGHIANLHLVGDALTPRLSMGWQMVRTKA